MKGIFTCLVGLLPLSLFAQTLDAYVTAPLNNFYVVIAGSSNFISSPVDLDFNPERPNELWILNQGTYGTGGNTVIIFNPQTSTRRYKYIKDGNASHFMALSSAMAFGGNGNWATAQDIQDANYGSGIYTGPTLWPGDTTIYGIVGNPATSQFNGSHLDMVHQSPFGKGIAFEMDNVYWVMDGYNATLKRYDFQDDHGPGQHFHSDALVRIYEEFTFQMHVTLPSHIVIDQNRKYLYGCDTKAKKIFRLDITTGSYSNSIPTQNGEALPEHDAYTGAVFSDIITTGLTAPVGIEVYGDRLIVTDNGSDEIIIYDLSNNFKEIGRFKPGSADMMGVKVGPDGKIYFVDKTAKKVVRVDNSFVFGLSIIEKPFSNLRIYPNPVTDNVIQIEGLNESSEFALIDLFGREVYNKVLSEGNDTIYLGFLAKGIYILRLNNGRETNVSRILIE